MSGIWNGVRLALLFPFYGLAFLFARIARLVWLLIAWIWASITSGVHDGWSR